MPAIVFQHELAVRIGIAVDAAVRTGVVHANIRPEQAIALHPGRFFCLWYAKPAADGSLQHLPGHAAGNVRAVLRQRTVFTAGANSDVILPPNADKGFDERGLLLRGYGANAGEILPHFFIQVDKADHAGMDSI